MASEEEHHTAREDLEVLGDPDCTAEEGSPGVDRIPGDGRNLEGHHTAAEMADRTVAEVVDHTDAAEEEGGHPDYCCSSHRTDYGHLLQHRREKAANLNGENLTSR